MEAAPQSLEHPCRREREVKIGEGAEDLAM
jgi:hypothetical protein